MFGCFERGQHLALGAEALERLSIARPVAHQLDRHLQLILPIGALRAVDDAHAATADDARQAPRAEGLSRATESDPDPTPDCSVGRARRPAVRRAAPDRQRRLPAAPRPLRAAQADRRRTCFVQEASRASGGSAAACSNSSSRRSQVKASSPLGLARKSCAGTSRPAPSAARPAPSSSSAARISSRDRATRAVSSSVKPAEDAAFDDPAGALVELGEAFERDVDGQHLLRLRRR